MEELKGTNVYSVIVPGTDEDTYATHDSLYGRGGYREVPTLAARDTIPHERLRNGCKVYVEETDTEYRYRDGSWIPLNVLHFDITTLDEYNSLANKNQDTLYMCKDGDSVNKLFIGNIPIFAGGSGTETPVTFILDSGILDRDTLDNDSTGVVFVLGNSILDKDKL